MLKVSLLVTVLRGIPEIYLLFMLIYILDHKPLNRKKLMLSTVIVCVITYFVRILPIHFGVHTILLIILSMFIGVYINKISALKSISGILVGAIILSLCEALDVWILQRFFNIIFFDISPEDIRRTIVTIPSLVLFFIAIFIIKKMLEKKEMNDENSKNL